jgi:hypothetical protein
MADAEPRDGRRPHRGRGRLSSIEMLPEEADEAIAWANAELRARRMPQTEIHRRFNAMLADHGLPPVTWSSFSRFSLRLASELRRMQASRDITNLVLARHDSVDGSDATLAAVELVKARLVQMIVDQDDADPKLLAQASLTLARLSATTRHEAEAKRRDRQEQREDDDREDAARKQRDAEEAELAAGAVGRIASEAGLSAERVAAIRLGVLGLNPGASPPQNSPGQQEPTS